MTLSQKRESPESIDRVRLQEFIDESNRDARDMMVGLPNPGYPLDQIGHNLNVLGIAGRCSMIAVAMGAPKHRAIQPALRYLQFIESLYPADERVDWRAASIAEEPTSGALNQWQVSTGPNASDFELRRGIELAIQQIDATERFIEATQTELARRKRDRHVARGRMRSTVAR